MLNPSEIKEHIRAVEQTRQITNAMYLLSTSRMKKTVRMIDYNVRFMVRLRATMKDIFLHTGKPIHHPYLDGHPETKSSLFIVISGDKGLCGSYHSSLFAFTEEKLKKHASPNSRIAVLGIMGEEYFRRHGKEPDYIWRGVVQKPTLYAVRVITDTVLEEYRKGRLDKVYVIFTHYVNAAVQEPVMIKLLPMSVENLKDAKVEYDYSGDILFDPSPEAVFERVVPQFIVATLFNAISQSSASEHAARMNAMQSATKNADEMLDRLRADYNARRQLAVTNELSETAAATQAVAGKQI